MTFGKFIEAVTKRDRVPAGASMPKATVYVRSAEGYVGRPAGLHPERDPKLDEVDVLDIRDEPDTVEFGAVTAP